MRALSGCRELRFQPDFVEILDPGVLTPGDAKRRGLYTRRSAPFKKKKRDVRDNKSFTQTGSVRQTGRKVVGRPLTGLEAITLFGPGISKVGFLHPHTGRDGKIAERMLREGCYLA